MMWNMRKRRKENGNGNWNKGVGEEDGIKRS
jgi:hypothetical protein